MGAFMSVENTHYGAENIARILSGISSIYFIGIGGINMSSLAHISHIRGYHVGGSDQMQTALTDRLTEQNRVFAEKGGLEFRSRCKGMLMRLGFEEALINQRIRTLSGGQYPRLALARLLATEPDILMLDEHTGLHNLIGGVQSAATDERAYLRLHLIAADKLAKKYSQDNSHSQD